MLSHFFFVDQLIWMVSTTSSFHHAVFLSSSTLPEDALNTFLAVFFSPHLVTLPYHLEVCASLPSSTSTIFHPAFAFTLFHFFISKAILQAATWYCRDTFSPTMKSTISFRLHLLHTVRHSFMPPLLRGACVKRFCGMTHKLCTNASWSLFFHTKHFNVNII